MIEIARTPPKEQGEVSPPAGAQRPPNGDLGAMSLDRLVAALGECERKLHERTAATLARRRRLPLIELAHTFHLSDLETDVLVVCLGAEIARKYERLFGHLQDD